MISSGGAWNSAGLVEVPVNPCIPPADSGCVVNEDAEDEGAALNENADCDDGVNGTCGK